MSLTQILGNFSWSDSNAPMPSMEWEGGDGWIVVEGTFTGAAQLNPPRVIVGNALSAIGTAPIPPITVAGTYAFTAPKGVMSMSLPMGVGDSVSALTVSIVSMSGSDL